MGAIDQDQTLSYKEAAAILGIKPGTLRVWVSRGQVTHIKLGRSVRFLRQDLQAHLDKNRVEARDG